MKSVENIFLGYIWEVVSLEKIFEIVQEPKMFKTDSFLGHKKFEFIPECLEWYFAAFLGDISILKSGWNVKKKYSVVQL